MSNGAFFCGQFVLIVREEEGKIWCIKLLVQKNEVVELKEIGSRIYVVRYLA